TRMGFRLEPTIIPLVLVSPDSRIDRPRNFDTSCVIKADALERTVMRDLDEKSTLSALASAAKLVSSETLEELARTIAAQHKPASFDYAARFGINPERISGSTRSTSSRAATSPLSSAAGKPTTPVARKPSACTPPTPQAQSDSVHSCRHCGSTDVL